MALKARTRGLLDAASQEAVDTLRTDFGRLAGELSALRAECQERDAHHARHLESLKEDLTQLADRLASRTEHIYATADDLANVAGKIELGNAGVEKLRINVAGIAEQLRWDSEDLRKGLAAVIERMERERRMA